MDRVAGIALFSKTSKFRAFQIPHNNQETKSPVIPVGGKHINAEDTRNISKMEATVERSGCCPKGVKTVSGALQCGQFPFVAIPRSCRLASSGRAPRHSFQRKSLSFGEVSFFQTFFCQLKELFWGAWCCGFL
ncbi:hypothetical protein Bca52824_004674 [Brassica carinata]|uniref:Uncharacterized protein n=1 Tax=Brassica carinata TaxID=52824 RepID=A0A8X7WM21_BRACI|nr:hypothetical protein Bca52824_004674 [Brassica carinata]